MLFHYSAIDVSGKSVEADYEADNLDQILQYLRSRELRPLSVVPLEKSRGLQMSIFKKGIAITDVVFLTKYLALMLRVGTDLLSAVYILIADFDKPAVQNFLLEVRDNLTKGKPFYEAF